MQFKIHEGKLFGRLYLWHETEEDGTNVYTWRIEVYFHAVAEWQDGGETRRHRVDVFKGEYQTLRQAKYNLAEFFPREKTHDIYTQALFLADVCETNGLDALV